MSLWLMGCFMGLTWVRTGGRFDFKEKNGWEVTFDADSQALRLSHAATGARTEGVLSFFDLDRWQGAAWRITGPKDGIQGRLSLVDPEGNVGGYLVPSCTDGALQIHVIHRREVVEGDRLFLCEREISIAITSHKSWLLLRLFHLGRCDPLPADPSNRTYFSCSCTRGRS